MADGGGVWRAGIHHSRVQHPKRLGVPGHLHIQGVSVASGGERSRSIQLLHLSGSEDNHDHNHHIILFIQEDYG